MDTDIRKPDTGKVQIDRPSASTSNITPSHSRLTSQSITPVTGDMEPERPYTEPLSEGEDEDEDDIAIAADENRRAGFTGGEADEAISWISTIKKFELREEVLIVVVVLEGISSVCDASSANNGRTKAHEKL